MRKVAIVTDSNSGITQQRGRELGIYVLPMPFYIDEELYFEDITLTQAEFFKRLQSDCKITTSQPSPGDVAKLWEQAFTEANELVYIPMSSGLSGSCQTAIMLSAEYEGKVQVVDNQRISVTQEQSVYDAMYLAKEGRSAAEIKEILEREKKMSSIYLVVDTLQYLKKGGRITGAAAALGTVLNIKPVLQIQGEKLDAYAKVRGIKAAKRSMIRALKEDLEGRFRGKNMILGLAYSCGEEEVALWRREMEEHFPGYKILQNPLSLSVSCHTGPGTVGITCMESLLKP